MRRVAALAAAVALLLLAAPLCVSGDLLRRVPRHALSRPQKLPSAHYAKRLAAGVAAAALTKRQPATKLRDIEPPADLCEHVQSMGYPCEHLNTTTADGFVLDIVHIPPKAASSSTAKPVVLQHGLLATADTYLANARGDQNLGTILHDHGYDVYLPNSRGNHYSLENVRFPVRNSTYWQMVDWDEMAAFDVPAVIDMVLAHSARTTKANATTVTWVGHSQGTAMMFAGMSLSAKPYASKINLFVALAPVAYVGHTTSLLLRILADLKVGDLFTDLGIDFLLENDGLLHLIASACPDLGELCEDALGAFFGWGNMANFADGLLKSVTHYTPGGTSASNLIHWAQGVRTNAFQMHDFGKDANERYYHQATPPVYNLSQYPATLPTVLVAGGADALADPIDVDRLVAELPSAAVLELIFEQNYAHMDPVWGLDAPTRIYPRVLSYIDRYSGGGSSSNHTTSRH